MVGWPSLIEFFQNGEVLCELECDQTTVVALFAEARRHIHTPTTSIQTSVREVPDRLIVIAKSEKPV